MRTMHSLPTQAMLATLMAAAALALAVHGAEPAPAAAQPATMVIDNAWSRATPPGATVGAGYFTVTNNGSAPDRLIGVTSAVADHAEVHEMTMKDGVMKMRPLAHGIEIKPGETVQLKPGGNHVMMFGLIFAMFLMGLITLLMNEQSIAFLSVPTKAACKGLALFGVALIPLWKSRSLQRHCGPRTAGGRTPM